MCNGHCIFLPEKLAHDLLLYSDFFESKPYYNELCSSQSQWLAMDLTQCCIDLFFTASGQLRFRISFIGI